MKKVLLFVFALFCSNLLLSQVSLKSGNLSPLKGENLIEVRFTYDNMRVGRMTEKEYVDEKIEEFNKKDGTGERWHNAWVNDRGNRFEPKFIELFNKGAKKLGIYLDMNREDTKYIMIVNTYFTEPGFNVGIQSRPAFVSMTAVFVERTNPNNKIAEIDLVRMKGSQAFDSGHRMQESYALAGKNLVKFMTKRVK